MGPKLSYFPLFCTKQTISAHEFQIPTQRPHSYLSKDTLITQFCPFPAEILQKVLWTDLRTGTAIKSDLYLHEFSTNVYDPCTYRELWVTSSKLHLTNLGVEALCCRNSELHFDLNQHSHHKAKCSNCFAETHRVNQIPSDILDTNSSVLWLHSDHWMTEIHKILGRYRQNTSKWAKNSIPFFNNSPSWPLLLMILSVSGNITFIPFNQYLIHTNPLISCWNTAETLQNWQKHRQLQEELFITPWVLTCFLWFLHSWGAISVLF